MDKNLWYWLLGVVVLVAVVAALATVIHYPSLGTQSAAAPATPAATSSSETANASSRPQAGTGGTANPAATTSAPYETALLQLNTTYTYNGVKVTPLSVTEDSRCPQNVQCVQAGTVKLNVKFAAGVLSVNRVFTLGVPQTAYGYTAELTDVRPAKQQGQLIKPTDYRFVFVVSKP